MNERNAMLQWENWPRKTLAGHADEPKDNQCLISCLKNITKKSKPAKKRLPRQNGEKKKKRLNKLWKRKGKMQFSIIHKSQRWKLAINQTKTNWSKQSKRRDQAKIEGGYFDPTCGEKGLKRRWEEKTSILAISCWASWPSSTCLC